MNKLTAVTQKLSPGLRKIIKNIGWLFADRVLRMGVGFLVGAWVARYLGPQQFGLYNYAIAFVSLFTALATLGLDQIVVRNIVREPSCKDETLGTTFALKFIGGLVTLFLTLAIIHLLRPDDSLTRWLVGITATGMIFQAFDTIDLWFQFQVDSKYTVVAKNTAFIIITVIKIALIQSKAPLIAFAWTGLLEIALGAVGLVLAYTLRGQNFKAWRFSWLQAKLLLKESWPMIVAGLSIMIYVRIDQIMLGELIGSESVGIYSVASRLSELWGFVPTAIVSSFNPSIIEAKKVSEELYYNKLQKVFNIMTVLAYGIAIPTTFLSQEIVVLLFGESYASSGGVLAIYIWGQLFSFLGIARITWIVTEGFTMYALVFASAGAIVNIILNFWLIPIYQETGAAIATVISYGLVDYVIFLLYRPFLKIGQLMTNALILRFVFAYVVRRLR
ncbi:flippase [Microcoleus sp. ZQ-A2]|nr:flippase [Microcoleus sp. FACHB-1]